MSNIVEFVHNQVELFNSSLTDESVVWEKESQFAIQLLSKMDPKNKSQLGFLGKTALANPSSAQNAIINVAAIGITLNPAAKLAYLVPRDGAVNLDISYMGLLHIAMTSGSIMWGQCKLVHENDFYESNGLDVAPTHKYSPFSDRGRVVGAYCTVKTPSGDYLTDEMSHSDIVKAQNRSKSANGPWKTDWNEMARKTVVKRAAKYWPKADRLDNAIHHLNTDGGEGIQTESVKEVLINPQETIEQAVSNQGKTMEGFFQWASNMKKREILCFDDMSEDELQQFATKMGNTQ